MSIETYEQIVETQTINNAISEAEEEYNATGILLDAKETLASLRRKPGLMCARSGRSIQ